ncbi:MAG: hypothetical protein KJ956_08830, partial [Actinobacteria bacterium]|nr:hypothetical protein [Actinomycetota bacterium]
ALAIDLLSRGGGMGDLGAVNYLFVWLLAHQAGYFYADGTLVAAGRRGAVVMAGLGLAGMVVLTTWCGYPVSMVEVPGQATSNTAPPSVGLVFLTLWLIGLAMAVRPPLIWWLQRERPWRVVTRLDGRVLTIYLWHVMAVTAAVAILYPLGFPQPDIGTGRWWLLRPVLVASMVPLLALLVAVFGRFEIHPDTRVLGGRFGVRRAVAMAFGTFSMGVCLLGFGITGFIQLADAGGAVLLGFQFNPLQNVLHGLIGALAMAAALRRPRWTVAATLAGGWVEWGSAETILGMNDVTAAAHLVAGALAVVGGMAAIYGPEDPSDGTLASRMSCDNGT